MSRDELDLRIRALEAERLRPVPRPPKLPDEALGPSRLAALAAVAGEEDDAPDDPGLRALRAAGTAYRTANGG